MNTATAIEHLDVYDQPKYYLKVTQGKRNVIINIGKTTYERIKKLDEPDTDTTTVSIAEPNTLHDETNDNSQNNLENNTEERGRRNRRVNQ